MQRLVRRAALAGALVATVSVPATAVDYLQDALKIVLRDSAAGSKAIFVAKIPPLALPADDPTVVGASFTIRAESGEEATFEMPAGANWHVNTAGTLFKFVNKSAPAGPSEVKVALIKSGTVLKVTAKSSGITLDEPSQGSVSVTFTVGSDRYCSTCGSLYIRKDEPGRFIARGCAAAPCAASPSPAFLDEP